MKIVWTLILTLVLPFAVAAQGRRIDVRYSPEIVDTRISATHNLTLVLGSGVTASAGWVVAVDASSNTETVKFAGSSVVLAATGSVIFPMEPKLYTPLKPSFAGATMTVNGSSGQAVVIYLKIRSGTTLTILQESKVLYASQIVSDTMVKTGSGYPSSVNAPIAGLFALLAPLHGQEQTPVAIVNKLSSGEYFANIYALREHLATTPRPNLSKLEGCCSNKSLLTVSLQIDHLGRVQGVSSKRPIVTEMERTMVDFLRSLRFSPFAYEGHMVAVRGSVALSVGADGSLLSLLF